MTILVASSTMGQLQGGWEYVIGAYVVTWVFLAGYAASLTLRRPSLDEESS